MIEPCRYEKNNGKTKRICPNAPSYGAGGLFDAYAEFLALENEKYNLTALDARQTRLKHFADSLSAAAAGILPQNARVCDIGSGAGFPAVPLKIVRNDLDMTLLDAAEKKTRFLSALAEKLNITDGIKIKHCRAEQEAGANRAFYDAVTARAVAPLNTLLEWRPAPAQRGRRFAAYKGANAVEEAERAENAALLTGASLKEIIFYSLENPRDRALVVYEKTGETPARFPRKNNNPRRKPL